MAETIPPYARELRFRCFRRSEIRFDFGDHWALISRTDFEEILGAKMMDFWARLRGHTTTTPMPLWSWFAQKPNWRKDESVVRSHQSLKLCVHAADETADNETVALELLEMELVEQLPNTYQANVQ